MILADEPTGKPGFCHSIEIMKLLTELKRSGMTIGSCARPDIAAYATRKLLLRMAK